MRLNFLMANLPQNIFQNFKKKKTEGEPRETTKFIVNNLFI